MNLFSRVKSWASGSILKAGQSFSFISQWIKTSWMDRDFLSLIQNGYKASSAVANCVRALAFSFPEPQLIAYKKHPTNGDQRVDASDALQKLIRKPNPDMGEAEFMQFVITYASCGGNVYLWKERSKNGKVIYLWPFSDKDVTPIPGRNPEEGFVAGYQFNPGDGQPIYLSKEDVIQWKWLIDPEQPWRGIGAIELATRDVSNDSESTRYTYAMVKNNAIPPVAITLTEGDELTDAKADRLRKAWLNKYGGEDNTGAPAFLESGMTIQKLGFNMQELDLSNLKNVPESRICGAFGVPPSIALLYVGLKRSDYGDGMARKSFTETTLVALWRTYESEMTASLSDEFGGGYELKFDLNQVKALAENVTELWTRLLSAVDKGVITRADFKREVGLKAGPDDEVYRESMIYSWVPVGEQAQPVPVTEPDKTATTESTEGGKGKELGIASQKSLAMTDVKEIKAKGSVYGQALQRIRRSMWPNMAKDMDAYFSSLSDRVVSRAGKSLQGTADSLSQKQLGDAKTAKGLPGVDDLLTPKDESDLVKLLKRWYVAIAEASWETINLSLGIDLAFDLADHAITAMLSKAGGEVAEITKTTRSALVDALQYGNEQGWSIGQLVKGDETHPGIQEIVEETYKNRSTTIARTELGNAQNTVTAERYKANGVSVVGILDNGDDDDDEPCKIANGQVWTLAFFEANPLEHPNCTRCSYPIFEDVTPDRS